MDMVNPSGDQGSDVAAFRAELRQANIAARQALTPEEHARLSARIEARLGTLLSRRSPQVIAFCWPLRNEFDCRPLVSRLLAKGWRAAHPVVVAAGEPMIFRPWTPDTPMTTDRHGIPVPAGDATIAPDVVLLPLVAFDERGYRLGYGGGYFDRTFAALSPQPFAVGVGFEQAHIDSVQPQTHDIPMNAIVTERGIREIVMPACFGGHSKR